MKSGQVFVNRGPIEAEIDEMWNTVLLHRFNVARGKIKKAPAEEAIRFLEGHINFTQHDMGIRRDKNSTRIPSSIALRDMRAFRF